MKKTYTGSCHCGAIRFEADLDISAGTVKCNCSICAKSRLWAAKAGPGEVRLLRGSGELVDYAFNNRLAHHYFCRTCGIHPYEWVDIPGVRQYYNVNIVCLEGLDGDEVARAPITLEDGRHDRWDRVPEDISLM